MSHRVQKSLLLWHSAHEMFTLVTDVKRYPEFLPWCSKADVLEDTKDSMHATLHIDYHGLKQHFTTRNVHVRDESVTMSLERGPFSSLHGQWRFHAIAADACKIEFELDYRFAGSLLDRAISPVFDGIASTFVDAFVKRAEVVYGQ
jgi:ribosome-associated toxin RatA of RatAB toxin-antitoxin module